MDMIISTQIVIGILGNFSLLCSYIVLHFMGYSLRSTDLILKHLIVANSLVLCKGVPQTMAVFGWKHIHNDFGCKLLFLLHRVGRGVSISSICLWSVFQAITISPWNSSSMVLILYRHKQQVQHIRGNNPFPRSFPESGDTKTILLLVSTFVYFYILSSIFQLAVALFDYPSCFLVNKTIIIAACFPTVSPFLLMSCDSSVHGLYFAWIRNKKIPYNYLIY
ncbi:hypothetical protein Celaphus_00004821, partial [Cervus elaphus hippelaphus]